MSGDITDKIQHVVVLMLENRSFDHIMGDFPGVNGIRNASYNLLTPTSPESSTNPAYNLYPIDPEHQPHFNPDHSFGGMMQDLFGPGTWAYLTQSGPIGAPSPVYPTQTNCGFLHGEPFTITAAANAQPIVISADALAPATGAQVIVAGVRGNTAANGTWTVTKTGAKTFSLQNSRGSGSYGGGGTWRYASQDPKMSYFKHVPPGGSGRLKVLHLLAEQFCLCDAWFCDAPTCTIPNRMFMHAATSQGYLGSSTAQLTAKSIYKQLSDYERDWAMYYYAPQDQRDSILFPAIAAEAQAQLDIVRFGADVAAGNLPFYTFIMPAIGGYGPDAADVGNSMHPPADVRWGENLTADIYNCLRNSPYWDSTLFIVTFDENGGIYDHVLPPRTVQPDYYYCRQDGRVVFDFTLLGPRIPAILISPWIDPRIDSTQYQNTSILRFVQDLIAPEGTAYLTERDRLANSFAPVIDRASPRTDCPDWIEGYGNRFNWPVGYISGATNASPIVITSDMESPPTGTQVIVSRVRGNTAANNTAGNPAWTVTNIDGNHFSLDGSIGDGDYAGDGTWTWSGESMGEDQAPMPFAVDLAKEYAEVLPGHPDSGKPITRDFPTRAALASYTKERYDAALAYYARARQRAKS